MGGMDSSVDGSSTRGSDASDASGGDADSSAGAEAGSNQPPYEGGGTGDGGSGSNTESDLTVSGPKVVATEHCTSLTVSVTKAEGMGSFEVTLSNAGRGAFFTSSTCAAGDQTTRVSVARDGAATPFYWKPSLASGEYVDQIQVLVSAGEMQGSAFIEVRRAAKEVDVGRAHACAVLDDGTVWCWGLVDYPVLPSEPLPFSVVGAPSRIAGIAGANVHGLTLGVSHACVLVGDAVRCFGKETLLGSTGQADTVVDVQGLGSQVTSLNANYEHTCVVQSGAVLCWGSDGFNTNPTVIAGLETGVVEVSTGVHHHCARKDDGSVVCWGNNSQGQLGNGTKNDSSVPVAADVAGSATALGLGQLNSCAVVDGQVKCWGLGFPSQPTLQTGLAQVSSLSHGGFHRCTLTGGAARCWGGGEFGELGDGTLNPRAAPGVTPQGLPSPVTAIAAGFGFTTCAIAQGLLYCWGNNQNGELGTSTDLRRFLSPTLVGSIADKKPSTISFGPDGTAATCAVYDEKTHCWGSNFDGALGRGDANRNSSTPLPQVLPVIGAAEALASRGTTTCAIDDQKVYCWGASVSGPMVVPTQISLPAGATPVELCAGDKFVCARATGTSAGVYCWGQDDAGQLGDEAPHPGGTASAVVAKGLATATDIACGTSRACAVIDSGVVCWGESAGVVTPTPTAIPNLEPGSGAAHDPIVEVAVNGFDVCARTDEGQVYCFRLNGAPVQMTLPSSVDALAAGAAATVCARDADGLLCWGTNGEGQVGTGTATDNPQPVTRVPGLIAPVTAFATGLTSCAVDSQGLKCWGSNFGRALGGDARFLETTPVLLRPYVE